MSFSDDSEDEEEIKKRLYADLDQVSVNDNQTERSFIFEQHNYETHDYKQSKIWLEFMNQNKQREEMLDKIENDIQLMKQINQGNQCIEIEDYNGDRLKVELNDQLPNEIITQIKEQPQQKIILHEEILLQQQPTPILDLQKSSTSLTVNQNQVRAPSAKQTKPNKQNLQDQKLELMYQQREMMQMEIEDNYSREYQDQWMRQLFKNRLYTLPEEFPALKPIAFQIKIPDFSIPVFKTPSIQIPQILDLVEDNLAPSNTKELVFTRLQNIKFQKFKYVETQQEAKPNKELQQLQQIDSELKYNIVYQDYLKNQQQLVLSDTVEDIYWKKVNNLHQDLMNTINKLIQKFPKYNSYRSPFTEYEQPKTNLDNISIAEDNSNLNLFQQYIQNNQVSKYTRKLEIKLENLTTLDGIQEMKDIRKVILSCNQLNDLSPLSALNNIIEVDLQQNNIQSYNQLGKLSNLRILRLEMNHIQEMSKLPNCLFLEVYSLKGNKIHSMTNLENLEFLKQLYLYKNQLKSVGNISKCLILEILDLSSNQIEIGLNENPFKNNQCLRKLILTKNKIQHLPEMRLLLLNELYLNKNKLESLDGIIYLPSLQILQVQDNQLQTCYDTEYSISYIPNIQQIDLSGNRIQSFGTIINFIQRCNELKQINYLENPFLLGLSEEVLQLYRYMLIINCSQLIEVNQALLNKKDQEFLKDKFYGFLEPPQRRSQQLDLERSFNKLVNQLNNNTQIMHKINGLEQRKITKIHPFTYTERFKIIQILNDLTFIKNNFQINVDVDKEISDFNLKYQKSLFKVQSLLIKWIYRFKRRQKYYKSKVNQLIIVQSLIRGYIARNQPNVKQFRQKNNKKKLHIYAIRIQKAWRRYIIRKRKSDRMKNIKFEDSELDELGEIDVDFLQQDIDLNFDLRIPQGIDLQQVFKQSQNQHQILQQQITQQAQQKVQQQQVPFKQSASSTKKPQNNVDAQMRTSHLSGTQSQSQMGQSKYSEKTTKTDSLPTIGERTKKIMQNWNFKDPAVAYTIACKLEKEQKRKSKTKELNHQERLERFKKH
ncbi:unnamed protein product (macronuclear) [Paramecium tetraurelia]|uniref:Uncharacterized protein n=1 Tax=Paramecium tetraurelia TaxID=5888 RepID=A0EEN6_PARTE|nr:uncharacterized protein GSPATT00026099001 [Paramecium tetraurelia]CAK93777.1 unnamed protein product [Paramecium tetraurelia]|eukprot:XP_001461150.1 hypothetical protein (macronuclear) [Paramecium tetraurelia strain d4-2]